MEAWSNGIIESDYNLQLNFLISLRGSEEDWENTIILT